MRRALVNAHADDEYPGHADARGGAPNGRVDGRVAPDLGEQLRDRGRADDGHRAHAHGRA